MKSPLFTKLSLIAIIVAGFGGLGFQCSSPNIQAGKLYFQQYQSGQDTVKLNDAIRMFRKEITENPNSGEGWYWLGIAEGMKKNYSELRYAWMKAKELGPGQQSDINENTPYMWVQSFNHGSIAYKKAQSMPIESKKQELLAEAEQAYLTANFLAPDSSAKYNGFSYLANVYITQGRMDDAAKTLEKQIDMNPTPSAYLTLGRSHILKGDNLKKSGNDAAAKVEYNEAISILNQGIKNLAGQSMPPAEKLEYSSDLNQILLNAYLAADRLDEATDIFKESAETNSGDAVTQFNYGTILLQKDDYADATKYLERAITLKPEYHQALQNVSAAYLRWGFKVRDEEEKSDAGAQTYKDVVGKAVPHVEMLMKVRPDDPVGYDLAARVYATVGNTAKAQEMYEKADALRAGEGN